MLDVPALTVYADGGVIQANPSPIGGTWAYRIVGADGDVLREDSGAYGPSWATGVAVGNNYAETLALIIALEASELERTLPVPFVVCSDSKNALGRLFGDYAHKGLDDQLYARMRAVQRRMPPSPTLMIEPRSFDPQAAGVLRVVLLEGHPSKAELARGYGKKGYPVSAHNVWCDQACQRAARQFVTEGRVEQTITILERATR